MRYYKIETNGKLFAIGTGEGGIEITKEEYEDLLKQININIKHIDVPEGTQV